MSLSNNKQIVRRYFEQVWNRGDFSVADEIIADCCGVGGGVMSGPEATKLYISSYRAAFPGTRFTILSMLSCGDKIVVCWASQGTHRSERTPCGKEIPATGLSVYRIVDGKIAAIWVEPDGIQTGSRLGIVYDDN